MTASGQLIDSLSDFLTPAVIPPSLYTIRGPIYVEPSSLQPPFFARRDIYGPPFVGPPVVGPPYLGSQLQYGPTSPIITQPVVSPSPYNPYVPTYPGQMMYDEQQDEVSPQSRRLNTNVQSGIQQIGQGNMNLQGNIQQVNRRSSQFQQLQASLLLSQNNQYH